MRSTTITARLPAGLADRLTAAAASQRRRQSDVIREALSQYVTSADDQHHLDTVRADIASLGDRLARIERVISTLALAIDTASITRDLAGGAR